MKIASWNVNSIKVRLPHIIDWVKEQQPDVLAIQETKSTDEDFPVDALTELGYEISFAGQKTYNGVAILSKQAAEKIVTELPSFPDPQRRVLGVTIGDIRILNLYVPNGQSVDSDKFQYKLQWLAALSEYTKQQLERYENLILLGDFNIAPTDEDVHDPEAWRDQVLCTDQERTALQTILDHGLVDTYRLFEQQEVPYSWWDYRQAAFRRNMGLRIDHILASKPLAKNCKASFIDKTPRGWERPSDHAPVVAEFDV